MQHKGDSMQNDNIWAISYRKLDILNNWGKNSIGNGDLYVSHALQRVQGGDEETQAVKRVHNGSSSTLSVKGMQSVESSTPLSQQVQNESSSTSPVQQVQDGKALEHHVRVARPKSDDRHRKCLVCLSAFVIMMLVMGLQQAFGTLFNDIMDEFQTTRASAASIQSVLIGVFQVTGILCGALVARFGPIKIGVVGGFLVAAGLILSYFANGILMLDFAFGVISGLGSSFLFISLNTSIALNFNGSSKFLALSLASTGTGTGGLSYPFLLRYLTEKYGLQETFLIVGGLTMNTIPCAILLGTPVEKDGEADETRNTTEQQRKSSKEKHHQSLQSIVTLFRMTPYMLFAFGAMCTGAPFTMFTIVISDIYQQKGFGESNSTFGISLMNIFGLFGRLATGILKQIPKFSALYAPIFCCVLGAILMTSMNFTEILSATLAVSAGLGFSFSVFLTTLTVTTVSIVGPELFSIGVGLIFTMYGVTNLAIGPLSGLVKDVTQSYESVLYGASVMMTLGCALFCLAYWIRRRQKQQENR